MINSPSFLCVPLSVEGVRRVFFWRRIAYVYVTVFSFFVIWSATFRLRRLCCISVFQKQGYVCRCLWFSTPMRTHADTYNCSRGLYEHRKKVCTEELTLGAKTKLGRLSSCWPDLTIFQVSPIPSLFLYHLQLENVSLFLLLIPSVQQQISSNIGGFHIHFQLSPSKTPVDVLSWICRGQGKWPNR